MLVNIRNEIPKLNDLPTYSNVVPVLADTPLLFAGTLFMIDALFGEANIPNPDPIRVKGNSISIAEVVELH
jgi:hypothetical protein